MTAAPEPRVQDPGRLIVKYLQENKDGATVSDVMQHLRAEHGRETSDELNKTVQSILESGTALGFLERKGSRFLNWVAREMGCRRRRRSRCRRRRRRRIRRRRSCRRRRRRRCRCGWLPDLTRPTPRQSYLHFRTNLYWCFISLVSLKLRLYYHLHCFFLPFMICQI